MILFSLIYHLIKDLILFNSMNYAEKNMILIYWNEIYERNLISISLNIWIIFDWNILIKMIIFYNKNQNDLIKKILHENFPISSFLKYLLNI